MVNRYLLKIKYDGRNFSGYQVQSNARTVGGELLTALKTVFGAVTSLAGCSRTDAGVHANEYYVSFMSERFIDNGSTIKALNAVLPRDIAVCDCYMPCEGFHARYSVVSKEYTYRIFTGKLRDPFYEGLSLHYPKNIELELLQGQASDFLGTHDFSSYMAAGSDIKDTVRTVYTSFFRQNGAFTEFVISADGFLYNMVRIIVGTLLSINEGRLKAGSIPAITESKDRSLAGYTAPPQGLYLSKVVYPDGSIIK